MTRNLPSAPLTEPGQVQWLAERIIFEDDRLLVLDKPAGLAVHGGSGVSLGCIEALRVLRPELRSLELVHRLDRATSGCLMVAKRRSALRTVHRLLREGRVEKHYTALLCGRWAHGELEIEVALSKHRRGSEALVSVDREGKPARSLFRPREHFAALASLVEIAISTGRTHQIRVHAAHLGHPVAGDERYGSAECNAELAGIGLRRMFLHAHAIGFAWPEDGSRLEARAPLPAELGGLLRTLRQRPAFSAKEG